MKQLKDIFYTDDASAARSLDIYLPDGECRAALLYMHGGGLENGKKEDQASAGVYLASRGYAFISINYRMYPDAVYPDFIYDAAEAVRWAKAHMKELCGTDKLYVGGSSAGGYLSMMLCFDPQYLASVGLSNKDIAGYWHDAGQPTAHFKVLKHSGLDSRRVIIDDSAPLYHVGLSDGYPPMRFIVSDNDMTGRYEQTMLLLKTLTHFGVGHFDHILMHGRHCEYLRTDAGDGNSVGAHLMEAFLNEADQI